MSNLSIRIKLLAIVIVTIVLVSIIIATKSIYEVNKKGKRENFSLFYLISIFFHNSPLLIS